MTVLLRSGQWGHDGLSALDMRWRCLLSGAWPVQSWNIATVWHFGRSSVSFRNAPDGRVSSIARVAGPRGDSLNMRFQSDFRDALICCLAADLLLGSFFLWSFFPLNR